MLLDGLPRIVFVSPPNPFDIECCDAFAEALADDFFWLIDVLAGRRVEGTRGCGAVCAFRPCPPAAAVAAARLSCSVVRASPTRARIDDSISERNNNRGGYCNASGPLGIGLPECQGPLETSPEEGGWFPESRGLRPCLT